MTSIQPTRDQKVLYQISKCSALVAGCIGTPQELEDRLYTAITGKLNKYSASAQLGPWTIVWGPVILVDALGQADNSMYVAQSGDDLSRYVIAIAGTNPMSLPDWLFHDLDISSMVSWRTIVGNPQILQNPSISQGTSDALVALLGATPVGNNCIGVGQTLVDFLSSLQKPINLITTGHSKGGALSPTLALWLKDKQSQWDSSVQSTISSMPTAGPTAGNQEFAAYSDQTLTTVTRFANSLDIVPYAWNPGTLKVIPNLYKKCHIPPDAWVTSSVIAAEAAANLGRSSGGDGDYTQLQSDPWWRIEGQCAPGVTIFEKEAIYQHTTAYDSYFSIPYVDIGYSPCLTRL